jgi:hypothetical protein
VAGKVEFIEVFGIETSLRWPCDSAPALCEDSRSLISTGVLDWDCGCKEGLLCVMP